MRVACHAGWFELTQLPTKLTEHTQLVFNEIKTGTRYSEHGW